MKANRVIRSAAFASVMGILSWSGTAAPPQVRTAPQPVMHSPNPPKLPVHNPDPQSGSPPSEQFTALAFHVWTGDDDLRSNSAAWITLKFPDGTSKQCTLRDETGDSWDNNSEHDSPQSIPQCILPSPMTFEQLKATNVVLAYDGWSHLNFGQNFDNWNVNRVRIEALDQQNGQRCLRDVAGYPLLVRLKGNNTQMDLTQTGSTC